MPGQRRLSRAARLVIGLAAGFPFPAAAGPAQPTPLSFRHYSVASGLANDEVHAVYQDRRGYMWFGTAEGLTSFDGYRFTTFGIAEGLGHPAVNAIGEDAAGRLWVATNGGGLSLLDERPGPHPRQFTTSAVGPGPANEVNSFGFDASGAVWCATDAGVFVGRFAGDGRLVFRMAFPYHGPPVDMPVHKTRSGELWFALDRQIVRIDAQGALTLVDTPAGLASSQIVGVDEDRDGRIVAATREGVFRRDRGVWAPVPIPFTGTQGIRALASDATGALWVGTVRGLLEVPPGGRAAWSDGVSTTVLAIAADSGGRLWLGTATTGVYCGSPTAVTRFTSADGLPDPYVEHFFGDADGTVFAMSYSDTLVRFRDDRITRFPLTMPAAARLVSRDRSHHWWFATGNGIWRTSGDAPSMADAARVLPIDIGSHVEEVTPSVYEDPRGRFWVGVLGPQLYALDANGRPAARVSLAGAVELQAPGRMLLDRGGRLWLSSHGGIGWIERDIVHVEHARDGLPETLGRALYQDSRGWLWIALRYGGVSVTQAPDAARVEFRNYSVRDGLSSASVAAITEDLQGRMYFATGRGLDRLDVASGRFRHFTAADGLVEGRITDCWRDPAGRIWIASAAGISRLDPRLELPPQQHVPVYVTRAEIAGQAVPISPRGVRALDVGRLPASRNSIAIDFAAVALSDEQSVLYQFRLDGVDAAWSAPTDQRSVRYARLSPGGYVFRIRAVHPESGAEAEPATFAFVILRPMWQQPWFVAGAIGIAALLAAAAYRSRVRRIVAMERVRSQVALDLHDELGSGLVQIAVLSEVAKRGEPAGARATLDQVADLARSLRESMSDIVWAVDPRKDHLADVVQRMRQTAYNLLEADGLLVEFNAPTDAEMAGIEWSADRRRQVLLVVKEAVTNVARHAHASRVCIDVRPGRRDLRVCIQDDGRGFATTDSSAGHGLASMRKRAESLGGRLAIRSQPGRGTTVELDAPLS